MSEGYIENNGGVYSYHYNITDHLGNPDESGQVVRAVLQKTGATTYDVVQRSDYELILVLMAFMSSTCKHVSVTIHLESDRQIPVLHSGITKE